MMGRLLRLYFGMFGLIVGDVHVVETAVDSVEDLDFALEVGVNGSEEVLNHEAESADGFLGEGSAGFAR